MAKILGSKLGSNDNDRILLNGFVDQAFGGAGNDTYVIVSEQGFSAQLHEDAGQGVDTVEIDVNFHFDGYTLQDNIENLAVTYTGTINNDLSVTGNALNNLITINVGDASFSGMGVFRAAGGDGNDTIVGGSNSGYFNTVNVLNGDAGNDSLQGGGNNDFLVGGAGADTMAGGDDGDSYRVDNAGDLVIEQFQQGYDTVLADVSYVLSNNVEQLSLNGTAITGTGNALDNRLLGNELNNTLLGLGGLDQVFGNNGNDSIDGGDGADQLQGNNGNDTLKGGAGDDALFGDDLDGSSGADSVDGGTGDDVLHAENQDFQVDTLSGGAGNDTFYVTDFVQTIEIQDILIEAAGAGIDTVYASAINTYTLAANIENLVLLYGDQATGNSLDNRIEANSNDNKLVGLAGNDTLVGNEGNDTMLGGAGNDLYYVTETGDVVTELGNEGSSDTIISNVSYSLTSNIENLILTGNVAFSAKGNELANQITGNANNNLITGGAGDDTLEGGAGKDTMIGGSGNDTYVVDNVEDVVSGEIANSQVGGVDTVRSSISYTLGINLEKLELIGTENIRGTGNADDNAITGSAGDNTIDGGLGSDKMAGGKGNDVYYVGQTGDVVTEGVDGGSDQVFVNLANYTLADNVEYLTFSRAIFVGVKGVGNAVNNVITAFGGDDTLDGRDGNDTLYAFAGADSLVGGAGDDVLDGGLGKDTMSGGKGDDQYAVDNTNDKIIENLNEGTDTVFATGVSYTLSDNIENLTLINNGFSALQAVTGAGNKGNNKIIALSDFQDILNGDDGNDTLDGGNGADNMSGGKGNDTYILSTDADITNELSGLGSGTEDTLILNFSSGGYTLAANIENATRGDGQSGKMIGNTEKNLLVGNSGKDELDAATVGGEADTLKGGGGNDTYTINFTMANGIAKTADVIIENANEGQDRVILKLDNATSVNAAVTANYTLAANVEEVTMDDGFGNPKSTLNNSFININVTGNVQDNSLIGNAGKNLLTGLAGNDQLQGLEGNDTLDGGDGNDYLEAGSGANSLVGGQGNDTLNSDAGLDTLVGGAGDDLYFATDFDTITDTTGIDTLRLSLVNLSNAVNLKDVKYGNSQIENAMITSAGTSFTLTGNVLDNQLTNASGQTATLDGGVGNDTLSDGDKFSVLNSTTFIGGSGNNVFNSHHLDSSDQFTGGAGLDTLNVFLNANSVNASVNTLNVEALNVDYSDFGYAGGNASAFVLSLNGTNYTAGIGVSYTDTNGLLPNGGDIQLIGLADMQVVNVSDYKGFILLSGAGGNQTSLLNLDNSYIKLASGDSSISTLQVTSLTSAQSTLDFSFSTVATVNITGDTDLRFDHMFGLKTNFSNATGLIEFENNAGENSHSNFTIAINLDNSSLLLTDRWADNLNVSTAGSAGASQIDMSNDGATITASGNQGLVVTNAQNNVNASALGGGLTLTTKLHSQIDVIGGAGSDNISGGLGDDHITGGLGSDTMTGGDGNDTFIYKLTDAFDGMSGSFVDSVTDFTYGADHLQLDHVTFAALSFTGTNVGQSQLNANDLYFGNLTDYTAQNNNEHLIYDFDSGNLYYDESGSQAGANDAILVANVHGSIDNSSIVYG